MSGRKSGVSRRKMSAKPMRSPVGRDLMALFRKAGKPRTAEDCALPLDLPIERVKLILKDLVSGGLLVSSSYAGVMIYELPSEAVK